MTSEVVERAGTEWSRDYTAFMRCRSGGRWMPEAEAQITAWLREKEYDVSLSESGDYSHDDSTLAIRRLTDGGRDDLRVHLVEEQGRNGTFTTELIAHDEPGDGDWIHLTVGSDQGRFVAVPRLARYLMQVLALCDGNITFSDKPQIIRGAQLDELIALLGDDQRHGLVFLAGTDTALPFDAYVRKVKDWSKEIYGLAQVVVLDPAATQAFSDRVGIRYAAPAWTIRTYHPGADFDDEPAARRHRILGTSWLANRKDGSIRSLLGDIVRRQAATRAADPAVLQVHRRFKRFENRRLVEAVEVQGTVTSAGLEPAPGPPWPSRSEAVLDSTADPVDQLALVQRILGASEITESAIVDALVRAAKQHVDHRPVKALERRVEELQREVEVLEDANRAQLIALEDAQFYTEMARLDVDKRDGKIRWLESRLHERGDYDLFGEVPPEFIETRPNDFHEFLERLESIDGVQFTGDEAEVAKLNQIDTNDAALRTAWDAVLVMSDYVKARTAGACVGGLDQYIEDTPDGYRTISKGKWGPTETAATMRAYGAQRVFRVPATVDPSGTVTMKAHFKLANIGRVSPRMHVFDGHPNTPRVFIGYIGSHLPNMQTN